MVRQIFSCVMLLMAVVSVGCCGPMGPGCGAGMGCNDCDGCGISSQMHGSPLDGFRHFKRSLVCGGGCGETYIGEWISTPPDCQDPCCGNEWGGGAKKCRPFCWTPGTLFGGLYGSRFCSGAESSVDCGCDGGCDLCGGFVDDVYADEGYYEGGSYSGGCATGNCGGDSYSGGCASGNCGGGCPSCSRGSMSTTKVVHRPAVDPVTRSAKRRTDPKVQRIRR